MGVKNRVLPVAAAGVDIAVFVRALVGVEAELSGRERGDRGGR